MYIVYVVDSMSFIKLSNNKKLHPGFTLERDQAKSSLSSVFPKAIRYIFYAFDEVYVLHCAVLALTR